MTPPEVTFYFDLGSPYAYLTAERLGSLVPEPVRWRPVLLGGLFRLTGRSSWARAGDQSRAAGVADIERRARLYGLPGLRWPTPWPSDYLLAMRAATYAFTVGRGREFTLQAFRDAFQRGRDLSRADQVLDVGAAVGIAPVKLEAAVADPAIKLALREVTDEAHARGVIGVPTVTVGSQVFWGDDRLEDAGAQVNGAS